MLAGVIEPPWGILKSETWFNRKARAIHVAQITIFFEYETDFDVDIKKPPK